MLAPEGQHLQFFTCLGHNGLMKTTTLIPFDSFFCDNYPKATVPVDELPRWQGDMVTCLRSDMAYADRYGLADHVVMRLGMIRKLAGTLGIGFNELRSDLQDVIRDCVKVCRDSALVVNLGLDVPEGQWFTVDKQKSRLLQAARILGRPLAPVERAAVLREIK